MRFENFAAFLTLEAALNHETYDMFVAIGIDPNDWPESLPKAAMCELRANIDSNGFDHASWDFSRSKHLHALQELATRAVIPLEREIILPEYQSLLKQERVSQLILGLQKTPQLSDQLVSFFNEGFASGVEVLTPKDFVAEYFAEIDRQAKAGTELVIMRNWPLLSKKIGGFNPGRFAILLADTGFGKTNIACQFASDFSTEHGVLFFNMEMTKVDFTKRLIACATETSYAEMRSPTFDRTTAMSVFSRKKIFYTGGKDLTLAEVQAVSRKFKRTNDIRFIIVDYDQKIILRDSKMEEWRELQKVSVALESLAKELNVFVLLLAQSNLEGGLSGSKRSLFAASTLLQFAQDEDNGTFVRANKNRFGKFRDGVRVDYYPEKCVVREREELVWIDKKKGSDFKRSAPKTGFQK